MKKSAFFDFFNDTDAAQFEQILQIGVEDQDYICLLYTSPSPRDRG